MSNICFQVLPPIARPDEPVYITGGLPVLGEWLPEKSFRLDWKPPYHVGEIEAETGVQFEYKIHRGSWETEAVDARGDVPGNLSHSVWLQATLHHTVADWKDRFRGRLTRDRIHSRVLAGWRDLLIWLPPEYGSQPTRRFPVIVLHDGANVFDPLTSPLSGVDWAADEWVHHLAEEGAMPPAIVVGICHPEGFSEENASLRDYDLSPELGGAAYAQFATTELISHLDAHYRTLPEPSARILGGASLGGLSSFYVALHHPGVFGKFVCLSTSFEDVSQSLPGHSAELKTLAVEPGLLPEVKMFFGYGTHGLDECYEPYHAELGSLLREKGWRDGAQFCITRTEGGHDELTWRRLFGEALRFVAKP